MPSYGNNEINVFNIGYSINEKYNYSKIHENKICMKLYKNGSDPQQ